VADFTVLTGEEEAFYNLTLLRTINKSASRKFATLVVGSTREHGVDTISESFN
jgi:hypothetical protein